MNACVKIINNEDYNQYEYEYLDDCEWLNIKTSNDTCI